nr:hypothetical protein [Tanacetum cinerariifolium]
MDVKSAFLCGTIKEEVYVCQPPRFEDPNYTDKVYKVVKALYGLHQAPRAWYETLANYLLENGFQRGKIDQTLFIKKQNGDILLVHFYVDEIIFGSTNKELCKAFEKLMKDMKIGLTDGKSASTPIDTEKPFLNDPDGEDVDVHMYRSVISSLMYLTTSKPDIMFVVCACARFQVTLEASHLHAVKRIFSKELASPKQTALVRIDGQPTIYVSCIKQFWASVLVKKTHDVVKLQALIDRKNVVVTEDTIRQDLRLDDADGVECLPNEEIFAELAHMGYEKPPPKLKFYKAFFSAQWKFLIHMIVQCMSVKRIAWNEFISTMASAFICLATCRKFNFSKYIFDSMVRKVDSPSKFLMYLWFLQVMINAQVDDLSSHTTKYTSPALTQKVFANMRRIGKGFSGVETPLFDTMLVQPQADAENEDDNEVHAAPTPQSPTPATTPTSPTHEHYQAPPEGQEVRKEDEKKAFWFKEVKEGRIEKDVTAVKEINVAEPEPTVFDDEEETMNMAQTLIKMKAKKQESLMSNWLKRTLLQESFKKLRAEVEASGSHNTQEDTPTDDPKEMSKEDLKNMLQIVLVAELREEALQVKYPIINWEIYSEGSRTYWKIIRFGRITQAYQSFEDMLKDFKKEDLDAL